MDSRILSTSRRHSAGKEGLGKGMMQDDWKGLAAWIDYVCQ